MFRWGRQVFKVGQAPSGPTVIRPLTLTLKITVIYAVQLHNVFRKFIVTFRRVAYVDSFFNI